MRKSVYIKGPMLQEIEKIRSPLVPFSAQVQHLVQLGLDYLKLIQEKTEKN